jgi:hypothetical protein
VAEKDALALLERRYEQERENQLRNRGRTPYIDLLSSSRFTNLTRDPWITDATHTTPTTTNLLSQNRTPVLIIGAGFGSLLFAIRVFQSGTYTAEDSILVDTAGGFGGTWYWNRYPGIMCDVESFIYLLLLEETGYMPSMKYVSGDELRRYAELLAGQWGLLGRGMF